MYIYIIPISTKQYWVVINKQKSSVLGKQTPTDKYQMFMLKNFECPICTVTYVQRKKKKLINIEICIRTLEGINPCDKNK